MSIRNIREQAERSFVVLVVRGIDDILDDPTFQLSEIRRFSIEVVHSKIQKYEEAEQKGELISGNSDGSESNINEYFF